MQTIDRENRNVLTRERNDGMVGCFHCNLLLSAAYYSKRKGRLKESVRQWDPLEDWHNSIARTLHAALATYQLFWGFYFDPNGVYEESTKV